MADALRRRRLGRASICRADSAGRSSACPKGVDADAFRPDGPNVRKPLRLGSDAWSSRVARLVPIKNVRAARSRRSRSSAPRPHDAHLLVVGDGPERAALRARAAELDLTDAVTFAGCDPARATRRRSTGPRDVFALSSDFDNSPNAVLEAMASGLPVVATDVGGVREFVDDLIGGAVVPRGIRGRARRRDRAVFSRSPTRRARRRSHNRLTASSEFSWRTSARQLLDVYRRVDRRARRQRTRRRIEGMKVAIRDDDTSYFTTPDALDARLRRRLGSACRSAWRSCRSRSATSRRAFRPSTGTRENRFALHRNPALVTFLRELIAARRVTIALHGYTHEDFPDGYEFQAAPDPGWIACERGRAYLESLLGVPHVGVRAAAQRAVEARSRSGRRRPGSTCSDRFCRSGRRCGAWEWRTPANWWAIQRYRRADRRNRRDPLVYPHALSYATHAEFGCHSLDAGHDGRRAAAAVRARRSARRRLLPRDALLGSRRRRSSACMRAFLEFAGAPAARPLRCRSKNCSRDGESSPWISKHRRDLTAARSG